MRDCRALGEKLNGGTMQHVAFSCQKPVVLINICKMEHSPTIRDLARETGLHNATVSRALRNDPRISDATRQRVLEAEQRLGYRRNPLYSSLMSQVRSGKKGGHSETVAFVTAWETADSWRQKHSHWLIYQGLLKQLEAFGWKINVFEDANILERRLDTILKARGIRAVILGMLPNWEFLRVALSWDDLTAVQIEPHGYLPMLPCICNDRIYAVSEAYRRTRLLGYRRVGLALPLFWDRRKDWISGYLGASYGIPAEDVVKPFYSNVWNQAGFAKWLRTEKPDAILSVDRSCAWNWLAKLKVRVPDDVAYVELDIPEPDGEVAGIRQSHEQVGAEAVQMLANRLYHNETGPAPKQMILRVSGEWLDGASAPKLLN